MKPRFIFSILVLSILTLGCSKDDINDTQVYSDLTETNNRTAIKPEVAVLFIDEGDFEYKESEDCGKGVMISSIGFINGGKNGKFFTEYNNCDVYNTNSVEAVFTDMEGHQLILASSKSGYDIDGNLEFNLQIIGGTGKYMNATGDFTVTNVKTFEDKGVGFYENTIKGEWQF